MCVHMHVPIHMHTHTHTRGYVVERKTQASAYSTNPTSTNYYKILSKSHYFSLTRFPLLYNEHNNIIT